MKLSVAYFLLRPVQFKPESSLQVCFCFARFNGSNRGWAG